MSNPFEGATSPPKPPPKKPGRKPDPKIASRNQEIARARPTSSLEELAKKYGVSRERIRQICEKMGVDNEAANASYAKYKEDQATAEAEQYAGSILMNYIAGGYVQEIAREMGLPTRAVQEVLDEQVTDEIVAARARNKTERRFPNVDAGPHLVNEPRNDRFWTEERVMEALVHLAKQNNGRLVSSTEYMKLSPTTDWLPSFPTVRNRLGRWTEIRVEVHRRIKQEK